MPREDAQHLLGKQNLVAEGLKRAWSGSQECDEDLCSRGETSLATWRLGVVGRILDVGQLSQRLLVH